MVHLSKELCLLSILRHLDCTSEVGFEETDSFDSGKQHRAAGKMLTVKCISRVAG
jgi:hypothetical protein